MSIDDWSAEASRLQASEREAFDTYQAAWVRATKANATTGDKSDALVAHEAWIKARVPLDDLMKKFRNTRVT